MIVNKILEKHKATRVLDLGCSEGTFLQRLSRCPKMEILVGLDIDEEALTRAKIVE